MMLQDKLQSVNIILGSKSPRRKELLKSMDIDFVVEVRETDESYDIQLDPKTIVQYIADTKLSAFNENTYWDKLIICADTVVVDPKGLVIGKPHDLEEAKRVLIDLSDSEHQVFTAVSIAYRGTRRSFVEETKVKFCPLLKEEIDYYVDKFRPLDKAGSYGIQEWIGRIAIEKIDGSYENVVGLPTARLYKELKEIFF